jgi:hypothetical protein
MTGPPRYERIASSTCSPAAWLWLLTRSDVLEPASVLDRTTAELLRAGCSELMREALEATGVGQGVRLGDTG